MTFDEKALNDDVNQTFDYFRFGTVGWRSGNREFVWQTSV